MHSPSPTRRPGLSILVRAVSLFTAVGMFGACDRHTAEEVPENYGHGSSHRRTIPDHQVDSDKPRHFSDTAGTTGEKTEEAHEKPAATPTGTSAPHF